jgi:hypothetical protein
MPISQVLLSDTFGQFRNAFNETANAVNSVVSTTGNIVTGNIVGSTLTANNLTSGRVALTTTAGQLTDDSALTYDTSTDILTLGGTTDASSSITGTLKVAGGVGVAKKLFVGTDLAVGGESVFTGNVTFLGSNTLISTTEIRLEDSILQLSHENPSDVIDIGFVGGYNNGANVHSGIFRDATDGKWKLFKDYNVEPTSVINTGGNGFAFADLVVNGLEANNNISVATGKAYQINSANVLSSTTLGSTVVNSSLTSVGTLTSLTVSGNTALGDSASADAHAISGATTLSVSSANAALRITQTGAGNALLVEDSANPDATPFVINSIGTVVAGYTSSLEGYAGVATRQASSFEAIGGNSAGTGLAIFAFATATSSPRATVNFNKSNTANVAVHGIVSDGEVLGALNFNGSDGTDYIPAAQILVEVDGTPGTNDMPGRLVFNTTADGAATTSERMRITNAGNVGIGTASPSSKLDVNGTITATALTVSGNVSFTSTGALKIPSGTTAQNAGFATVGMLRYDTTLDTLQVYKSTGWASAGGGVSAAKLYYYGSF